MSIPIEDYAMIGDGESAALARDQGGVIGRMAVPGVQGRRVRVNGCAVAVASDRPICCAGSNGVTLGLPQRFPRFR